MKKLPLTNSGLGRIKLVKVVRIEKEIPGAECSAYMHVVCMQLRML